MVSLNANGKRSFGSGVAFLVLATIAVALRLYSKSFNKAKWTADDIWIGLSLLGFFLWTGVQSWCIFSEVFQEDLQSFIYDSDKLQTYLKCVYMIGPLFALTVTASKLSILQLYRRIFISQRFQRINLVVSGMCLVLWFSFTVVALNPCRPVRKFWQPYLPGHCYSLELLSLSANVIDIFLDISVLILPIKPILHLQMSKKLKAQLCAIFLVGGFVIITGIVRLSLIIASNHLNSQNFASELTNIHLGTVILCACLPTYRPIISRMLMSAKKFNTRVRSVFSVRRLHKTPQSEGKYTMSAYSNGLKCYDQFNDPIEDRNRTCQANIEHASNGGSFDKVSDRDLNQTAVEYVAEVV